MRQRIVYVWLPRLETDRIVRFEAACANARGADSRFPDVPLAVVADSHNGSCLHAINGAAQMAGVIPGMMVSAARTICPGLVVRPLDLRGDQKTMAALVVWCRSFTPLVARDGLAGLFLDVTGCAHLFGGEQAMLRALTSRLSGFGFDIHTALADTAGAAWALARFGRREEVVPPGKTASRIAALPVAGLRLERETSDMLNRLGLKKIENLYGLARSSMAARFGMELVSRLDQALGRVPEPLEFDREAKPYRVSVRFLEPVTLLRDIETSLGRLLSALCERLLTNGLGVRRLVLTLMRVDNSVARVEVGTVAPNRSPEDLARLFRDKLESLEAGFGFERIRVHATSVQAFDARQIAFSDDDAGNSAPGGRGALSHRLIDRLVNRLGPGVLRSYVPAESHMPERAYGTCAPGTPGARATAENTFPMPTVARPLRLFQRPIAVSFDGPGGGGSKNMNAWGRSYKVRSVEGPERICAQWWHNDPVWSCDLREYWWVSSDRGQRLWIFKQRDEGGRNQWFLHGLGA